MTEKKTAKEELLEKIAKTEELLEKISKNLEDPNRGIEISKEKELQIDIAKLQADSARITEGKIDEPKPTLTKPAKLVKRRIALALGIICILSISSLAGAVVYYGMKLNDKENQINSAESTINRLNAAMADENNTIVSSNANILNLMNQESQLQIWLNGNESLLNQTQKWLNGNSTGYEVQISSLNAQIIQLRTWLSSNITAYQNEITLYTTEVNQYNSYIADHHHTDEDYNATSSQNANLNNITNLFDSVVWEDNVSIEQPAGQYTNWTQSSDYAGYVSVLVHSSNATGTPGAHVGLSYSAFGVNFSQETFVSVGGTAVFPILPSNITVFVGNANLGFEGGASETVTVTYFY